MPRPDPAPPAGEGGPLISFWAWAEAPLLLNLMVWALCGLFVLGGVQPTDGGWAAVLPFLGGISLFWILLWVFALPNRIVVAPCWLARRLGWRWRVIRAGRVAGIQVRPRGSGPPVVVILDREGRRIAISPRMAKREEQREAVLAFLRQASPPGSGEGPPPLPAPSVRRRRVWRNIWRAALLVAILLNALVGVLRLATAFH